jgi:hypothetical protein
MAVARSSRSIGAGGFAYVGGLKLPASQPIASDFIGSVATVTVIT